jgi:hypothetical protein
MSPADFQRFSAEAEAQRRAADPQFFLRDLHAKAQAARFAANPQMVQLIPLPEVSDSGWGDLLAEPLLDMLTEGEAA